MVEQAASRAPLTGVRVLDFTHVISGPFCTMMLADMGADVVKIERPGTGDDLRHVGRYPGRGQDDEDYFYSVNRRKRSIVLDLSKPEGRDLAQRLALRADVVIQNFAPGTAEKLGIGAEELRKLNPQLVYCAISGFGQTGPLKDRVAVDAIVQAFSGVMSVNGEPGGGPLAVGAPIADVAAGMFAAYAVVASLFEARRTGRGASIDVSMLESMIAMLGPRMGETLQAGRQPQRTGNENPMRVPAGTFEAAEGRLLTFISHDQGQWPRFCRAMRHPEWVDDPRFATMPQRVVNREALNELIRQVLRTAAVEEWIERFNAERIPCAPVYDYKQALENEHITERGLVLEIEHPKSGRIRVVGPPWRSTLPEPPLAPPPQLGESTAQVLRDWLEADDDRLARHG